MSTPHHRIVTIGAGSAGLCTAVNLNKAGIDDYTRPEKGDGLDVVWRTCFEHAYPERFQEATQGGSVGARVDAETAKGDASPTSPSEEN